MRRFSKKPERSTVSRAVATLLVLAGHVVFATEPPPFDKALFEQELPLRTWHDPADLVATWSGKKVVLGDVYLSAEGHWENEVYASSCSQRQDERPDTGGEEAHCPRVYLGRLQTDEIAAHMGRIGDRTVNVYVTVGQVVPRPFARQFGMFEGENGAWVEDGTTYFRVNPDSREFAVPEEGLEDGSAAEVESAVDEAVVPEPLPPEERLLFKYRLVDEGENSTPPGEFLPLQRTALLYGAVEFLVESPDPEALRVEQFIVHGHEGVHLSGNRRQLCESSPDAGSCVVVFGPGFAGRRFRIEVFLLGADNENSVAFRDFTSLDAHPSRVESTGPHPPDEITRLVRVEIESEEDHGTAYRIDLTPEAFDLKVVGIPDARVTSATRPADDTPILIPIFLNVAPYLVKRNGDDTALDWAEGYAGRDGVVVRFLRDGLFRAARGGVEAEYMVVDYAATARLFGPFRLVPGDRLTPEQKDHNDRMLDALVAHLRQPPLPEWRARRAGKWVSDVTGPLRTLDDLYFRTFPGLVGALLVTEGADNPTTQEPIVQSDLWVERLEQINEALSPERTASVLEALDAGRGIHDEAVTGRPEIAAGLSPAGAGWSEEDCRLQMDALLVPGPASIDLGMLRKFEQLIDERFGGEVYRVYRVRMTPQEQLEEVLRGGSRFDDTKSVGQMIRTVYDQLRGSYVVTAEIPNVTPDGSQRLLTFKVQEAQRTGKGKIKYKSIDGRVRFVPYYTSSGTTWERLSELLGSPFSLPRLLAAYEIRKYWNDPSLASLLQARLATESDREIRRVLFESAVVQNLLRLQATPLEIPDAGDRGDSIQGAYRQLQEWADEADRAPDPLLAREAARLAGRYRRAFPEHFDGS